MPIRKEIAPSIYKSATKDFSKSKNLYNHQHPSIQKIFFDQWDEFLNNPQVLQNGLRDVTLREVNKMLNCATVNSGFEIYECPDCYNTHIICYTCKSRFCSSCVSNMPKKELLIFLRMLLM